MVRLLYTHAVGQPPGDDDMRPYLAALGDGSFTRASLTLAAAQTDLVAQRIDLVGLQADGLDYGSP